MPALFIYSMPAQFLAILCPRFFDYSMPHRIVNTEARYRPKHGLCFGPCFGTKTVLRSVLRSVLRFRVKVHVRVRVRVSQTTVPALFSYSMPAV